MKLTREQKNLIVAKEVVELIRTLKGIKKISPVIFEAIMKEVNKDQKDKGAEAQS